MNNSLLVGKLTRLVQIDPEPLGENYARWARDTEFMQLFDTEAPVPRDAKKTQEWLRKRMEKARPGDFGFVIYPLEDDRPIGVTGLWDAMNPNRDAWVSVGIGERELWGKRYGSDALDLTLGFAFRELNLHRVNLNTFEFNERAVRSYLRLGFQAEGEMRGAMRRYGRRYNLVYMGVLREEWYARHRDLLETA